MMLKVQVILKRLVRKDMREVIPLREILNKRVGTYRGSTNWDDYQIVQRPIWDARK